MSYITANLYHVHSMSYWVIFIIIEFTNLGIHLHDYQSINTIHEGDVIALLKKKANVVTMQPCLGVCDNGLCAAESSQN